MATVAVKSPPVPGVVLHGVSWADYEAMLRIVGNRPIRINYDRGRMEIMSPLWRHGNGPFLLGRMVDTLVDELEIPYEGADPVTFRRPDLERGVEPDRCFYFRDNAARVRGKRSLDMAVDPPPDLVIEADLTSSSIPRLPIFAALGIPEVWRLDDDEELQFLHLQPDATYQPRDRSRAFPEFLLADAARFLEQGQDSDKMALIRTFRAFVREVLVHRPGEPR
jgi:Uma2 family endonuclease